MRALLTFLFVAAGAAAEDVLGPAEAAKKIGEKVVLAMEVKSSKLTASRVCYLNSCADFDDKDNFAIYLPKSTVEKFKGKKIDDPAAHFKGKKIRVTGTVTLHKDKPQIQIDNVDQLKLAGP